MTFICRFSFYVARLTLNHGDLSTPFNILQGKKKKAFFSLYQVGIFSWPLFLLELFKGQWLVAKQQGTITNLQASPPFIISCCNILCTFLHFRVYFALHYFEVFQCNCKQIVQLCLPYYFFPVSSCEVLCT